MDLRALWDQHRTADWPKFSSPNEGELMTLDTVISGCATYYLDSDEELDPQRIRILEDCVADLDGLLPTLAEDAAPYFEGLRQLARLLLEQAGRD